MWFQSWFRSRFGSRERERRFNERWGDLAQFNSERNRGVVHTPGMVELMAAKQAIYNEMQGLGLDVALDPLPSQREVRDDG